jgi:hypothetical protein
MKKYIYSPHHLGLVLAPLMTEPNYYDYLNKITFAQAEEAYNTWLSSPPAYKVRPEDIEWFSVERGEDEFEIVKQILITNEDGKDEWMSLTAFPSMYDEMIDQCRRLVAIPKKGNDIVVSILSDFGNRIAGNESKEQSPSVDLDQVVYVPTPIEGEEIPPWGDSNLYLLYDNGEIVNHLEDEQPFAICTHWLKKTTIRELIHQPYK